ncbi:MAG: class I SAM-dependent methyltransferase [Kiritimatiellia bacterium]
MERLAQSLANGSFVRLVLSGEPRITARLAELRQTLHVSFTLHETSRAITHNLPVPEAIEWVRRQLESRPTHARTALLCTTQHDWQLTPRRLIAHKPSITTAPSRTHDLRKQTLGDRSTSDWLAALELNRHPLARRRRQVERYVEILSHLAKQCKWQKTREIVIADMGCGSGYLTFAAWQLFRRVLGWPVRVIGVEVREELARKANQIAGQIKAEGLEFVSGAIQSVSLPKLDGLITLHACDTATDDVIERGISQEVQLIVVAPCCRQRARVELGCPAPLAPVLAHGVMYQRLAEWVTDALRALTLEQAGYRTKIIEFVDPQHTVQNIMIAGIRTGPPFNWDAAEALKSFLGIRSAVGH